MLFQNRTRLWLLASAVLIAVHLAWHYAALPEKMPTHFGPDGTADGWMNKSGFAGFQLGMTALLTLVFLGIGWLMKVLPAEAVNLPNKGYWLAPERRADTIRRLGDQFASLGVAVNLFFLGVQDAVVRAALSGSGSLGKLFPVYFAFFIGYTIYWTIGLVRRWSRV